MTNEGFTFQLNLDPETDREIINWINANDNAAETIKTILDIYIEYGFANRPFIEALLKK